MLAVAAAALLQIAVAPDDAPRLDEVRSWSKFEAAERLLPAAEASVIVDGRFGPGGPPGFYSGWWWRQAEPAGGTLCNRAAIYANLMPLDVQSPTSAMKSEHRPMMQFASTYPQTATPEACAIQQGWISTTPDLQQAKLLGLERLIDAIQAASTDQPLPFEINCESTSSTPCGDARTALRGLTLATLYDVAPVYETYRSEPIVNGTRVRYAIPPADGVFSTYEAKFGPGETADSWFVTLRGRDRLEQVTLRRATVIYH